MTTLMAALRVCVVKVPWPSCCRAVMSPPGVTPTTTCTGPHSSSSGVGSTMVRFSVIWKWRSVWLHYAKYDKWSVTDWVQYFNGCEILFLFDYLSLKNRYGIYYRVSMTTGLNLNSFLIYYDYYYFNRHLINFQLVPYWLSDLTTICMAAIQLANKTVILYIVLLWGEWWGWEHWTRLCAQCRVGCLTHQTPAPLHPPLSHISWACVWPRVRLLPLYSQHQTSCQHSQESAGKQDEKTYHHTIS